MNNIIIKNNELFGDIRFVEINDKPYAVANDIAKALGYKRPNDAVSAHCKGTVKHSILTNGGNQLLNIIPEGDIYRLIMKSKLPTAEQFESWVMDEVLPSIRKHGMYAVDELLDNPDLLIATATRLKEERELRLKAEAEVKQLNEKVEVMTPAVQALSTIIDEESCWNVEMFAKTLGIPKMGRNNMFKWMKSKGILKEDNLPYQHYSKYFKVTHKRIASLGSSIPTTLIRQSGVVYLHKKLVNDGYIVTKPIEQILDELNDYKMI